MKHLEIQPTDDECERAASGYLMSLVVVIIGLPLPIVNLIATFILFLGHRSSTYFVRWHALQALVSQLLLFFINSYGFWWTISIIFTAREISNEYISYILTITIINLIEFIMTIYAAIQTRKGEHVRMAIFADITDVMMRKN